jgi:hypothetical protein
MTTQRDYEIPTGGINGCNYGWDATSISWNLYPPPNSTALYGFSDGNASNMQTGPFVRYDWYLHSELQPFMQFSGRWLLHSR